MRLQHNRQWTRWVPILLWIAGVIWVMVAQGEAFDVGMAIALITAPVGLGIPILGVFVCNIPRSRRVYAGTALASAAAALATVLVIAAAAVLSSLSDGIMAGTLYAFGSMLGTTAPLLMGTIATAALHLAWMITYPKPEEEQK